ncbi:S-adenosylmethionine decarboxylase proenzyme [Psychromonas antarctica]|uniref:S-adenosylmethionine decarboxylase proenzyme n=1 Tax=Psychromonas antarctica TaxID=67573 RepID=UPI001EE903E1|nr:S-adenosylmethionine decarboxylase proenzyme [Psychromonas antarctica]MCG6200418.1 S-adenosylmethionine decarboxylase proenzyme [Psychromonas antarctica]
MFYEGSEKRLEIILKENNLLQFSDRFWGNMVAQAGACILSKIETPSIRAYLLSESSLFIWKNKLLLITCGNTHLLKAAQFFQKNVNKEQIQSLLFHRHQPARPELQKSNFMQDYRQLYTHLQGSTQHWQGEYQGDLFFFGELETEERYSKQLLMLHGLSGSFADRLQAGATSTNEIITQLAVLKFFPPMLIDQFTFTPKGYSLNAIAGNNYLTIHITPEKLSTYLSVESSFNEKIMQPFLSHLVVLFKPQQSNLMFFNKKSKSSLAIKLLTHYARELIKTLPARDH